MRTRNAALGTAAFVAVPATVAGLVPWWLAGRPRRPSPAAGGTARAGAVAMMVGGAALVTDAFARFVRARGTPAPIAETEALVVTGPYRLTRNPQYVGVIAVTAGQAWWWRSRRALAWAIYLAASFHGWIRLYEEPRLANRFGPAYAAYRAHVPRWLLRLPGRSVSPSRGRRRGRSGGAPRQAR